MIYRLIAFLLFSFLLNDVSAQHQDVFPNLTEDALLNNLVSSYKPSLDLTQAMSRDSLFGNIDSPSDTMTCVYSGFKIWLDPTQDPTQAAFMGGGPNAINTEHTYPQSLGATGQAQGDMHHLYPTRADVNQARGNLPFGEINDASAVAWYYLDQSQSNTPSQNIDLFSERSNTHFEVPEAHKGNVARSMFYFYTMYKDQADQADPNFFDNQKMTLCEWHLLDPVDQAEWNRTFQIAEYQDGKPNPFVLDCTLAERSYCINFGQQCDPVSTGQLEERPVQFFQNAPNPFSNQTKIQYTLDQTYNVKVLIFNNLGQEVEMVVDSKQSQGTYEVVWESPSSNLAGTFFCHLMLQNDNHHFSTVRKMIVLPE